MSLKEKAYTVMGFRFKHELENLLDDILLDEEPKTITVYLTDSVEDRLILDNNTDLVFTAETREYDEEKDGYIYPYTLSGVMNGVHTINIDNDTATSIGGAHTFYWFVDEHMVEDATDEDEIIVDNNHTVFRLFRIYTAVTQEEI